MMFKECIHNITVQNIIAVIDQLLS